MHFADRLLFGLANLEDNDKIKAELKPVKINEPKTPYHGPLDMDALPDEGERWHLWNLCYTLV